MKFTKQQHKDFKAYEKVRTSGRYNMFDPRARAASGLGRDEFLFVLNNYKALHEEVIQEKENQ